MRTTIFLFTLQLIATIAFSQVTGTIVDKETRQPVPYANVGIVGKKVGTTSDTQGNFTIATSADTSRIVVSAIGYEPAFVGVSTKKTTIELTPKQYSIKEVVVKPQKRTEVVVDKLTRKSSHSYSCSGFAYFNAKYFPKKDQYNQTPYLKRIRVLTRSQVRGAKFNVRLVAANEQGKPGEEIVTQNLIASAPRGKRIVTIDLREYHVKFPANGLFVVLEWLIIEENKHEYTFTYKGERKKHDGVSYEPNFCVYIKEGESNMWGYYGGNWHKNDFILSFEPNKYQLAIELTLTD